MINSTFSSLVYMVSLEVITSRWTHSWKASVFWYRYTRKSTQFASLDGFICPRHSNSRLALPVMRCFHFCWTIFFLLCMWLSGINQLWYFATSFSLVHCKNFSRVNGAYVQYPKALDGPLSGLFDGVPLILTEFNSSWFCPDFVVAVV